VPAAVAFERGRHRFCHAVSERPRLRAGRHDVVERGKRTVGRGHRPPSGIKFVERLRARDLVDQVQADIELRLSVGQLADRVAVPDFLKERLRHA
jgi:hypothetical protein